MTWADGRAVPASACSYPGLFTTGPYSLARAAYAASLVDLAENGTHVRDVVNITG
jgi:hypothetical protein